MDKAMSISKDYEVIHIIHGVISKNTRDCNSLINPPAVSIGFQIPGALDKANRGYPRNITTVICSPRQLIWLSLPRTWGVTLSRAQCEGTE